MNKDILILLYLKDLGIKQSMVKTVAKITTKKYHDIGKGKNSFTDEELNRLYVVFPELKNIYVKENND